MLSIVRRWLPALAAFCIHAGAGAQIDGGGRIATRVVAQRLVLRCELSSATKRIPAHLTIELDSAGGFELHGRAAQGLEIVEGDPVTVHLAGFKLRDLVPEAMGRERSQVFDDVTKYHATELGEVPCVGALGFGVLKSFHLVFDLARHEVTLSPARSAGEPPPTAGDGVVLPLDVTNGVAWFPVEVAGSKEGMFLLGTSRFDTAIDEALCRRLGRPAGDVGMVEAGTLDFSPYVAFRPSSVDGFHPAGALGATGINLLQCLRAEIDVANRRIQLAASAPARFPEMDLAYFQSMVSGGPGPVEDYLVRFPAERLSPEAAQLLLDRRLEGALDDPEALERAISWIQKTTAEDRRATKALDLMDLFERYQLERFQIIAARAGIEKGRLDRDPTAVHKLHARLGELELEGGRLDEAWRHLLSASFGMKEDGMVNLNLGLLYEKKGKHGRAFSRFVQAVITEDAAARALDGLKRAQAALGGEAAMSIDVIERLIEGRVPGYRTANRFQPTDKTWQGRTCVAQLFCDAQIPERNAADLAFDALASYFAREQLCVLAYHLPMAGLDGLTSPVALEAARDYQIGGPMAIFNGTRRVEGTGREDDKERFFEDYKRQVLAELEKPAAQRLELSAKVVDGEVRAEIVASGPADAATLDLVLAERGVLFPGKSKIAVHHWVVRGRLQPVAGSAAPSPKRAFAVRIDAVTAQLEEALQDLESQSGASLALWPTSIDPRQLSVVALLKSPSGEILQAAHANVAPAETP
jgi:hypothetical protein